MDLKLTGKNVLVTGGAAGIGAGICKVFAAEGANVVVNYRSHQAEAEAFAQGLRETYGVDALAIQADITAPEATEKLFTQALAHFGILDVLVNNAAGGICFKPFQEYTGSMEDIAGMLGMSAGALKGAKMDEKATAHMEAIILAMTPKERENPGILGNSRKKRIAAGSGTTVMEVNRLLKQYEAMLQLFKQMNGPGGKKMKRMAKRGGFPGLGGMGGGFPGLPGM